jgi:hypothetical protein
VDLPPSSKFFMDVEKRQRQLRRQSVGEGNQVLELEGSEAVSVSLTVVNSLSLLALT